MTELTTEKTMTTREVAEALGVSIVTIRNNGKDLFPNKVIENGKPVFWTETEAKLILEKIRTNQAGSKTTCKAGLQVMRSDMTSKVALMKALDTIDFDNAIEQQSAIEAVAEINKRIISALQKKVGSLQIELDASKEYASIKRMEALNPERKFNWRVLKAKAEELGSEVKKVFDQNYGEVNSYHKSVWGRVL